MGAAGIDAQSRTQVYTRLAQVRTQVRTRLWKAACKSTRTLGWAGLGEAILAPLEPLR